MSLCVSSRCLSRSGHRRHPRQSMTRSCSTKIDRSRAISRTATCSGKAMWKYRGRRLVVQTGKRPLKIQVSKSLRNVLVTGVDETRKPKKGGRKHLISTRFIKVRNMKKGPGNQHCSDLSATLPLSRFQRQLPSERGAKITAYSVSITAGRRGRGWLDGFLARGPVGGADLVAVLVDELGACTRRSSSSALRPTLEEMTS